MRCDVRSARVELIAWRIVASDSPTWAARSCALRAAGQNAATSLVPAMCWRSPFRRPRELRSILPRAIEHTHSKRGFARFPTLTLTSESRVHALSAAGHDQQLQSGKRRKSVDVSVPALADRSG